MVLAGLVPSARRVSADAPRALARAFARLSWPAYALLVGTGIWNVLVDHLASQSFAWRVVLWVKVGVVVVAGAAALAHTRATSKAGLAIWGALSGLSAMAALVLGVLLGG